MLQKKQLSGSYSSVRKWICITQYYYVEIGKRATEFINSVLMRSRKACPLNTFAAVKNQL